MLLIIKKNIMNKITKIYIINIYKYLIVKIKSQY